MDSLQRRCFARLQQIALGGHPRLKVPRDRRLQSNLYPFSRWAACSPAWSGGCAPSCRLERVTLDPTAAASTRRSSWSSRTSPTRSRCCCSDPQRRGSRRSSSRRGSFIGKGKEKKVLHCVPQLIGLSQFLERLERLIPILR